MNHQAALHEALESLLRDERLAPCWAPLVAPLRRIHKATKRTSPTPSTRSPVRPPWNGEPHISELFALLAAGFERPSEPYASGEMAARRAELSVTLYGCAALVTQRGSSRS